VLRSVRDLTISGMALALLAACSAGSLTSGPSVSSPVAGAASSSDSKTSSSAASRAGGEVYSSTHPSSAVAKETLYILNLNNPDPTVAVYSADGKTPIRTIDLGKPSGKGLSAIAVDSVGQLVAANRTMLTVYGNKGANVVRTLTQSSGFVGIALDKSDNLYTVCGRDVCEYKKLQKTITRRLTSVDGPYAITTDQNDNVAVASGAYDGGIQVFPPTGTKPSLTISNISALSIAFDQAGNLYADTGNTVAVYSPGTTKPSRTISLGSSYASALSFDSAGNLYLIARSGSSYSIHVFAPGASTPMATISSGLNDPVALALDETKSLYVANNASPGSVTVYQDLANNPTRTITKDIFQPTGVAAYP
jgi:hypothetical protein